VSAAQRLEMRGVTKRFGGVVAVEGVDLVVGPGEVVGLIGPNDAGKSTLLKIAARIERPTQGSVVIDGRRTDRMMPASVARLGVHYGFQRTRLLPELSVQDHVAMALADRRVVPSFLSFGWIHRTRSADVDRALTDFEITHVRTQAAADLSFGQRQLLCLAMASVRDVHLLMLDEPLAGLSGESIALVRRSLDLLVSTGVSVIVVEHRLKSLAAICGRFVVMDRGRLIADGLPDEVMGRSDVLDAYFGGGTRR